MKKKLFYVSLIFSILIFSNTLVAEKNIAEDQLPGITSNTDSYFDI